MSSKLRHKLEDIAILECQDSGKPLYDQPRGQAADVIFGSTFVVTCARDGWGNFRYRWFVDGAEISATEFDKIASARKAAGKHNSGELE